TGHKTLLQNRRVSVRLDRTALLADPVAELPTSGALNQSGHCGPAARAESGGLAAARLGMVRARPAPRLRPAGPNDPAWCNWQHKGFWCPWTRFESLRRSCREPPFRDVRGGRRGDRCEMGGILPVSGAQSPAMP